MSASDPKNLKPPSLDLSDEPYEFTETKRFELPADDAPLSRRDRAYVLVLSGSRVGQMIQLGAETVVGRGLECAVRVEGDGVSRRHARIIVEGSQARVEDMGSANGTLVNGVKLEETRDLVDGDKIRVGPITILKFTFSDRFDENFQREMYDAALKDRLTQAFNKAYFTSRLDNEFAYARRHQAPLSLVMIDVDHFKNVNDMHGHLAGDSVLAELGKRVAAALRVEDVFARYGGEEFAVICRGVSLDGARQLGERLRLLISATPFQVDAKVIPVTISVGVSSFPHFDLGSATALVASADGALLLAKRAGRNRVVVATT